MVDTAGYEINVEGEGLTPKEESGIRRAAEQAMKQVKAAGPCGMTVLISTDEHVRHLNNAYAGNDYATDVLTFPAEDEPYEVEPGEPPYLGDVIIARGVAQKQADEAEHSLLAEFQLLTIHGTLHLLGFDHQDPDQQATMWAYQSAAMDALRAKDE